MVACYDKIHSMKIGIDARLYGTHGRGIGRYITSIIRELESMDTHNEYVVFVSKQSNREYQPRNSRFTKILADCRWYSLKEQVVMPILIRRANISLMWFPHFNVPFCYHKPCIVTIHDLILHHFSDERATTRNWAIYALKRWAYFLICRNAIQQAKTVIAVSEYTKQDIINFYPSTKHKIKTIYEGVDVLPLPDETQQEQIVHTYGITKPFCLYVGAAYPHKNLKTAINGFMQFQKLCSQNQKQYMFVIVGQKDYFHRQLAMWFRATYPHNQDAVRWIGYVPDQELAVLYHLSYALLYPSLYEGFGLPPVEAIAYGCPVVASNCSSLPEILTDNAMFVNPHSSEDICHALTAISPIVPRSLYKWNKCAQETLQCFN